VGCVSELPDDVAILRLAPDAVVWREVGDEVVVYGAERSEYLATNATATLLWPLLAHGATLTALAGVLSERWGVSPEQARGDVEAFVTELRTQGLLEA
jgi:hypothetical protein